MSQNLCLLSKKKNLRRTTGHTTISVDRPLIWCHTRNFSLDIFITVHRSEIKTENCNTECKNIPKNVYSYKVFATLNPGNNGIQNLWEIFEFDAERRPGLAILKSLQQIYVYHTIRGYRYWLKSLENASLHPLSKYLHLSLIVQVCYLRTYPSVHSQKPRLRRYV